jgi:hypothetical protein
VDRPCSSSAGSSTPSESGAVAVAEEAAAGLRVREHVRRPARRREWRRSREWKACGSREAEKDEAIELKIPQECASGRPCRILQLSLRQPLEPRLQNPVVARVVETAGDNLMLFGLDGN